MTAERSTLQPGDLELLRESVADGGEVVVQPAAVDGVYASAIVYPRTTAQVNHLLNAAFERNLKVAPAGRSTFAGYGNPPSSLDLIISTRDMNQILDYSPADMVVSAQAGATLADVQAMLAKEGQFLPVESPLPDQATLGGAVAMAPSGPLRLQYGPPRDWLIGVQASQADGTLIKSGGKVVKNVTGYDIMKLSTGSLGSLLFFTELSFKLMPLAHSAATLIAHFDAANLSRAGLVTEAIINAGLLPSAITLLDPFAAASVGLENVTGAVLLVEMRNTAAAVKRQVDDASRILREAGAQVDVLGPFALAADAATPPTGDNDGARSRRIWHAIQDFSYLDQRELGQPSPAFALKASSPPKHAYKTWQTLRIALGGTWQVRAMSHLGTGLTFITATAGASAPEPTPASIGTTIETLRKRAAPECIHVVVERVAPEVKTAGLDVWGNTLSSGEIALMRRIKQNLDPSHILNPGRYIGGI